MSRTTFLVDGFNLYHSLVQAERDTGSSVKWLNIRGLCESYLSSIDRSARYEACYYFSAIATYLDASDVQVTRRHRAYIDCLADSGINIELSSFKKNRVVCKICHERFNRYEEKETDVAIASKLLELIVTDACDAIVIVSGDTDLSPAVRASMRLRPEKRICFGFPYARKNKSLAQLCPGSFLMDRERYKMQQFADPYIDKKGRLISKPASW